MQGIQGGGRAESIGQCSGVTRSFDHWRRRMVSLVQDKTDTPSASVASHTRQRGGIGRSLSQPMEYLSAADSEQVAHTGGELDSGILEKRFNLTV